MPKCRVLALAVWVGLLGGCAERVGEAYPPPPAVYEQLAADVEEQLLENVLPAWFPRCVDDEGGFYASFDDTWQRGEANPKSIVYQARQTWVAATIVIEYPELAEEYRPIVLHGAEYLHEKLWDAENGGFLWALPETFAEPPRYAHEKHLYGNAFAIYALARAHEATQEESLIQLAVKTYRWWEQHAHDAVHGGYFEALTRDGHHILADTDLPVDRRRDPTDGPYGYKSANTHLHVLEALTGLYRAWPNEQLETRLLEVLELFRNRIAVEPGCLNQYFTPDWRPLPYGDSFGHDIEAAFLMLDAAEALGARTDPRDMAVARDLVDHALDYGWDEEYGGFFHEGTATSAGHDERKSWWVQAEGLNALLLMHERFGDETDRYWRAFIEQWAFIDRWMVDRRHGGWRASTTRDGRVIGQNKASIWKAAYHNVRALVETAKRLRRLEARERAREGAAHSGR
jgi:mannobiose 2-epimerase